jgi:hypothetical protein
MPSVDAACVYECGRRAHARRAAPCNQIARMTPQRRRPLGPVWVYERYPRTMCMPSVDAACVYDRVRRAHAKQAKRSDTLSLSRLSDRLRRAKSTIAQNRIACGALESITRSPAAPYSRLSSRLRRALVDLTDTHFWRLPIVAMRNMTVACDAWGAGAQAGVRHRDGRTPRPYRLRRTHAPGLMYSDSRPVKLADSPPSTYRGARRCAGMRTAQADKMPNLVDLW